MQPDPVRLISKFVSEKEIPMPEQKSESSDPIHTLEPVPTAPPATLVLDQTPPARAVALREVEIEVATSDGRRATTVLRSPDLPPRRDATGQHPKPLPPTVLRAVFAFYFVGSAIPIKLTLDAHACFRALEAIFILLGAGRLMLRKAPTGIGDQVFDVPPASLLGLPFTAPKLLSEGGATPKPRYVFRKGLGVWDLIFEGEPAAIKHERGAFYANWLLYHPDETPLHALDLMTKIPELYRQQLGIAELIDPATGKSVALASHARLQERSLALDDRESMRALFRKQRELENLLDSGEASEPVKAEALRDLEAIYDFQRRHGRRSRDSARRAAHAVRSAIARFHEHLRSALGNDGGPHPVLRPFAEHIEKHILIPSARYAGCGGLNARTGLAGCFTYEQPGGISWKG
jgi:hypothetical protein